MLGSGRLLRAGKDGVWPLQYCWVCSHGMAFAVVVWQHGKGRRRRIAGMLPGWLQVHHCCSPLCPCAGNDFYLRCKLPPSALQPGASQSPQALIAAAQVAVEGPVDGLAARNSE